MAEAAEELPLFSESGAERRGVPSPHTTLAAAVPAWEEALVGAGRSPHTVKAFGADVRLLTQYLSPAHPIGEIGTADLRKFLEWMANRRGVPCSPKTYARRVTSLKSFFRWLKEHGVLPSDPAAPLPQQTVLSPLPEVLTAPEAAAVNRAAQSLRKGSRPDARPATLFGLLLQTGIKKGECLALQLHHIDLRAAEGPTLFVRYGEVRKRYKERKLPLEASWIPLFQEYLQQYQPRTNVFPWSPRRLEYLLEDLGEAAGLDKHLSFDMCRWTSALQDYRSGMDRDRIRQKLGLSRIQWREVGTKLDRLAAQGR
jgi:integrase/recombinase XerD